MPFALGLQHFKDVHTVRARLCGFVLSMCHPIVLQIQVTLWMLGVLSNGTAYDLTTVGPPSDLTMASACACILHQVLMKLSSNHPMSQPKQACTAVTVSFAYAKQGRPSPLQLLSRSVLAFGSVLKLCMAALPRRITFEHISTCVHNTDYIRWYYRTKPALYCSPL